MLQVIGAGFGRTGTHSLAVALGRLGFGPCYTLPEVNKNPGHIDIWNEAIDGKQVDWRALYRDYRSAVEWPTVSFLRKLLPAFPEARVILTMRDPDSWYESAAATIFPGLEATAEHPDPETRARSNMKRRLILEQTFSGRYWEKAHAIEVYQTHVQDVLRMVPAHRLLQFRVADGWDPLCEFLEVREPDEPFPWRNERASFLASAPDWAVKILEGTPRGKQA